MTVLNLVGKLLGVVLISYIFYYIYTRYFKRDVEFIPNNEYKPEPKNYQCILFYTTWCPHCKKTIKDWNKYSLDHENEYASFSTVDCDVSVDKAKLYEIDSYPTILLIYKEKKYIFDSDFTEDAMDKFIHTILNI